MKNILLFLLSFTFSKNVLCQEHKRIFNDSCSNILQRVSYFWRLDSLGQNGYRYSTHNEILYSTIDKITITELIEWLGKPSYISKDKTGYYYCYYYFDGRKIPLKAGYSKELSHLFFKFDLVNPYLLYVGADADDY
jgi:hypothetical protein